MPIFRIKKDRDNPYVQINKTPLHDKHLSAKAKGILAYLLTLPDNWRIYEIEITRHFRDGRDSIRSGIKELVSMGYIERQQIRQEEGKFAGYEYFVYEVPQNQPANTVVGKADIGKSNTTKNNITKHKKRKRTPAEHRAIKQAQQDKLDDIEFNIMKRLDDEPLSGEA